MANHNIILQFSKLVEQLKYDIDNNKMISKKDQISNRYRLKHIMNALSVLKGYTKQIKSGKDLEHIDGIGKGIINRIDEIIKTGNLKEVTLRTKEKKYLKNVEELQQIIGIGSKTAYDLVMNHNIKSIPQLQKAHKSKKIDLPENILIGLKYYNIYKTNIPRKDIDGIKVYLLKTIGTINQNISVTICGSYRRGKSVSSDIDVLISHKNVKTKSDIETMTNYLRKVVTVLKKDNFLVDDITFDKYQYKYMGFCKYTNFIRRIDIRYVPHNSYSAAILYFTGPGEFNSKMRNVAKLLGYKLNEYGLYKLNKKTNSLVQVIAKTEKSIFDKLDLEYLEPCDRQ